MRLFYVEDDRDLRNVFGRALRNRGYDVVEFADGADLLSGVAQAALGRDDLPDAIVSDFRMRSIDGLAALSVLLNGSWKIPYVLVSAFCDPDLVRRAFSAGAVACLAKPLQVEELDHALRGLLTPRRLRERLLDGLDEKNGDAPTVLAVAARRLRLFAPAPSAAEDEPRVEALSRRLRTERECALQALEGLQTAAAATPGANGSAIVRQAREAIARVSRLDRRLERITRDANVELGNGD